MKSLRHLSHVQWLASLAAVSVAFLCLGCGGTVQAPQDEKSELLAAGFKVVPATTPQQQAHLRSLAPGKITAWQRTGKTFYVYPDMRLYQLYVGTQKEYDVFRRLSPGTDSNLGGQQAADMASYERQDDAMRMRTQRDLADPYYFWKNFDDLGWQ